MNKKQVEKYRISSKFKILDGYGHDGSIIFKAGTTCYRSEDKTKKTPEDFIRMFKKLKHMSMTEFMWVSLVIRDFNYLLENAIFSKEKFLISNRLSDQNTVVSGNARAWLDFMERFKEHFKHIGNKKREQHIHWIMYNTIGEVLNAVNPVMFDLEFEKLKKPLEISYVESIDQDDTELYNIHNWVAIKFENVSRGLIDQFVRHRLMSYAVSSTRYIDNRDFKFVLGDLNQEEFSVFIDTVEKIKAGYTQLLELGVNKDIARQLLPLGISQEMVVAGTIENWRKIFEIRLADKDNNQVHWEIKNVLERVSNNEIFK